MNTQEELITKFYSAFKHSDSKTMIDCYHPEVEFSDPGFPLLKGKQVFAMWAFFCQRKTDPKSRSFSQVRADKSGATAHWEAQYIFPGTKRFVHNKINARFLFRDGKIIHHVDTFDFWKWSRMAFGPIGLVCGWSHTFQRALQKKVRRVLDDFIAQHPEFQKS